MYSNVSTDFDVMMSVIPPSLTAIHERLCKSLDMREFYKCLDQVLDIERYASLNWALPLYGYVMPTVIAVTCFTNIFCVAVLRHSNMRTPTNLVLLTMSLTELATGLSTLPWLVYYYTLSGYEFHQRYGMGRFWCLTHSYFSYTIPSYFHTASCWLMVYLCIQRYIYICQSQYIQRYCTIPFTRKTIVVICFASLLLQDIPTTPTFSYFTTAHPDNPMFKNITLPYRGARRLCLVLLNDLILWVGTDLYFNATTWYKTIFANLLPSALLIVFTRLLVVDLKLANRRRAALFGRSSKTPALPQNNNNNYYTNGRQPQSYRSMGTTESAATRLLEPLEDGGVHKNSLALSAKLSDGSNCTTISSQRRGGNLFAIPEDTSDRNTACGSPPGSTHGGHYTSPTSNNNNYTNEKRPQSYRSMATTEGAAMPPLDPFEGAGAHKHSLVLSAKSSDGSNCTTVSSQCRSSDLFAILEDTSVSSTECGSPHTLHNHNNNYINEKRPRSYRSMATTERAAMPPLELFEDAGEHRDSLELSAKSSDGSNCTTVSSQRRGSDLFPIPEDTNVSCTGHGSSPGITRGVQYSSPTNNNNYTKERQPRSYRSMATTEGATVTSLQPLASTDVHKNSLVLSAKSSDGSNGTTVSSPRRGGDLLVIPEDASVRSTTCGSSPGGSTRGSLCTSPLLEQDDRQRRASSSRANDVESRRLVSMRQNTRMLIVIIALFLLLELPVGAFKILHAFVVTLRWHMPGYYTSVINTVFMLRNVFVLMLYPVRLVIYCGMSEQFRCTARQLFSRETLFTRVSTPMPVAGAGMTGAENDRKEAYAWASSGSRHRRYTALLVRMGSSRQLANGSATLVNVVSPSGTAETSQV